MVLGAGLHGALDVRDADPAGRLQADPARARAVARPGVGAGHAAGRRGHSARADSADGARQQDACRRPRSTYQGGTPEFQPIEKTTRAARGQHGQGHPEGRRPLLHVLPGRVVHVDDADGPVGGHRRGAEADLRDSGELAVAHRHLRHGGGVERRRGGLRDGGGLHGSDGRVGLRRVGQRLLLSAVRRVRRRLPVLLPALSDLRVRRLVQPLDRRLHARRGRPTVPTAAPAWPRATTRGPAPTRAARWPTVRTARAARRTAYNPRTGTSARRGRARTCTAAGEQTGVQRGDSGPPPSRYTNNVTGTTTRATQTSGGGTAVSRSGARRQLRRSRRTGSGDVYAGHDGNVYRKQGDSWQKYGDGGWSGVEQPTPQQRQQAQDRAAQAGRREQAAASGWDSATASQVNRDSAARAEGAQRTRDSGQRAQRRVVAFRQLPRERRGRGGGGGRRR